MTTSMAQTSISTLLGDQADSLLNHKCTTISKELIHTPGPDFIDRVFAQTNRSPQVLRSTTEYLQSWSFGRHRIHEHFAC